MITYIIRRLFAAVILLFVISLITFFIFYVFPKLGGQTTESLAAQYVGKSQNPQAVQAIIHRFGFDQSIWVQYGRYVKGIFTGYDYSTGAQQVHCPAPCLGYSFRDNQLVWQEKIVHWLPVTLSLSIGASVMWLVFGVAVGVASALRRGTWIDRGGMFIALAGVSLPVYFVGPLAVLVFVENWHIFPDPGWIAPSSNLWQWFWHLLLPWAVVAFGLAALYARLMRVGMLDTLNEDFIRTARAKGLSDRKVTYKHALRAGLIPVITIFGLDVAAMLAGAIFTERIFDLPGLGNLVLESLNNYDLPVIMGTVLVASVFLVAANLVVDIVYSVIDPRVRLS